MYLRSAFLAAVATLACAWPQPAEHRGGLAEGTVPDSVEEISSSAATCTESSCQEDDVVSSLLQTHDNHRNDARRREDARKLEAGHHRRQSKGHESESRKLEQVQRIAAAPEGSPVAKHGRLKVVGNELQDEHGKQVILRGISQFWSQWAGQFYTEATVKHLLDDWTVAVTRATMGVEANLDGYLSNESFRVLQESRIVTVVDAAIKHGMYVMIDWHDYIAWHHKAEAVEWFDRMAKKYGNTSNVLWETWNEPSRMYTWEKEIKPYHEEVLAAIRKHSTNVALLSVADIGTDLIRAAKDQVNDPADNAAYTFHFYTPTHTSLLMQRVTHAKELGIAVYASEWSACPAADPRYPADYESAKLWVDFLEQEMISSTWWAVMDLGITEPCTILYPGNYTDGWENATLTEGGEWIRCYIRRFNGYEAPEGCGPALEPAVVDVPCSQANQECIDSRCCQDPGYRCIVKSLYWASCRPPDAQCTPGQPQPGDPDQGPWECTDVTKAPCSEDGQACMDSRCCQTPGYRCLVKNSRWAACRSPNEECIPGEIYPWDPPEYQTPWECRDVTKGSCSQDGQGCLESKCCQTPGYRCLRKDEYWAACRSPDEQCVPGEVWDKDPPKYQTPWDCTEIR